MIQASIQTLLKVFFRLLYNQFAWTYDIVSAIVSMNQWKDWVFSIIPYIQNDPNAKRVLELGYGTAHLMMAMLQRGFKVYGIDNSASMARMAYRRLSHGSFTPLLVRGDAQHLPFSSQSFQCVVATFPTSFIYEQNTLQEIHRVLIPQGRLIVLLEARIHGLNFFDKLAAHLFKITAQSYTWSNKYLKPFLETGFEVQVLQNNLKRSTVILIVARSVNP